MNFIQQEYPQTIALILAYLEPGKAAVIMQNLPEDMQAEVSKRLFLHCLQKTILLPVVLKQSLKS